MFNGEIMFHSTFEKDTEKVVLLDTKGFDTNYCQVQS